MYLDSRVSNGPFSWKRGYLQSMNDAGNVTEDGEQDVDQKITTAATLEEDSQRGEDDGKDDLADIAVEMICQSRP
jgi:hypothetical protein